MTVKDIVRTSAWLAGNAEKLKVSTREDRCAALLTDTGIRASVAQLARVESELGFTFARPASTHSGGSPNGLTNSQFLAKAILDLYTECSVKVPEYLSLIARKQSLEAVEAAYNNRHVTAAAPVAPVGAAPRVRTWGTPRQ